MRLRATFKDYPLTTTFATVFVLMAVLMVVNAIYLTFVAYGPHGTGLVNAMGHPITPKEYYHSKWEGGLLVAMIGMILSRFYEGVKNGESPGTLFSRWP